MARTAEELLYLELTHFARKSRRLMHGIPSHHDMHDFRCPQDRPLDTGFSGDERRQERPFPHGRRSPVLSRERILTILLDHEPEQEAPRGSDTGREKEQDCPEGTAGLRQKQLSEIMHINASSMSEFIGHLEQDGYVQREIDPSDRRATLITLTEKGRARACELQDERSDNLQTLFSPLTEEEKRELLRLLQKLQQRRDE